MPFSSEMLAVNCRSAIIRNDKRRDTIKEFKCIGMSCKPRRHFLVQKSFTIEESAIGQRHYKYMYIYALAGVTVSEVSVVAGPVSLPPIQAHGSS